MPLKKESSWIKLKEKLKEMIDAVQNHFWAKLVKIKKPLPLMILFVLFADVSAKADVVWPALYLEDRLVTWWAIILGLIVEYFFVRKLFGFGVKKAILADIFMNLASTLLGIVLIPLAGIIWEFFPGEALYRIFNVGTFNPGTWAMTFFFAVVISTVIESLVIRWGFKTRVGKKGFWGLFLANTISTAVAFISVFLFPQQL